MTSLEPSSEIVRQVQKQANRSNQCNKQPVQPVKDRFWGPLYYKYNKDPPQKKKNKASNLPQRLL